MVSSQFNEQFICADEAPHQVTAERAQSWLTWFANLCHDTKFITLYFSHTLVTSYVIYYINIIDLFHILDLLFFRLTETFNVNVLTYTLKQN